MTTEPTEKSFKEVLDEHIRKMPSDTYFAMLKAHCRELEEVRKAHTDSLNSIQSTIEKFL